MRLKIQKGKQRRLADHERVHVAMVNRRDKALRDAMAVLTKAQKEVKRQYEVAEAQRTKEEEEFMDAKGNAAVEELEEFVKTQKEGKRLLKATKDAVFAEMKRELKKKGARLAARPMAPRINGSFCAQGDGGPVAAAQVPPGQAAGS